MKRNEIFIGSRVKRILTETEFMNHIFLEKYSRVIFKNVNWYSTNCFKQNIWFSRSVSPRFLIFFDDYSIKFKIKTKISIFFALVAFKDPRKKNEKKMNETFHFSPLKHAQDLLFWINHLVSVMQKNNLKNQKSSLIVKLDIFIFFLMSSK